MSAPPDPTPELTTTRLGGGRSARLVGVGVAVLLVAVVYVGVSGQGARMPDPSNDATVTPPAMGVPAALTPAPNADASPAPPAIVGSYPGATQVSDREGATRTSRTLGVALTIGGRLSLATLDEFEPRHYHTAYHVPLPVPAAQGTLLLLDVAYWPPDDNPYATWSLPLSVFDVDSPPGDVLLDTTHAPQPDSKSSAQMLAQNGYRMQVTGERNANGGQMNIDLTIGSDPVWPPDNYELLATDGNHHLTSHGEEVGPGMVRGRIELPKSFTATTVAVQLNAIAPDDQHPGRVVVGTYTIVLPPQSEYPDGARTLDQQIAPSRKDPSIGILANGYDLKLIGVFEGNVRVLFYELRVNAAYDPALFPNTGPPSNAEPEHHWITGDDGLVGFPGAALPSASPSSTR